MMKTHRKKALIAVNTIGFMWFIWDDIDILQGMGFDVIVAGDNSRNEDYTVAEIERRGASFIDIRCTTNWPLSKINYSAFRQFRRLMADHQFDAIICHTPITGLIVRAAAAGLRRRGTKVVYMSHGLAWTKRTPLRERMKYKPIERFGSRLCDAIITINDEDYVQFASMHCPAVYKVNGVGSDISAYKDVAVDREHKLRELGVSKDKILVLAIGTVSERKNQIVIAQALSKVPHPERYCFMICGIEADESIKARIIALSREHGFEVKFMGLRNDIPEIVHVADIGVMPSLREGLGMAGIQMLCGGVPVIGTNVQGIPSYVEDDETGFIVDNPHDADAFAKAIVRLSEPELRVRMAPKCIAIVEKFGQQEAVGHRRQIYNEIFG